MFHFTFLVEWNTSAKSKNKEHIKHNYFYKEMGFLHEKYFGFVSGNGDRYKAGMFNVPEKRKRRENKNK